MTPHLEITSESVRNCISIMVRTPDGTITVMIEESDAKRPVRCEIFIGKAGSSLRAWAQSLSELITLLLPHVSISHIIQCLSNQNSDKIIRTDKGVYIHSGPSGVAYCLHRYNRYKQEEGNQNVQYGRFKALEY